MIQLCRNNLDMIKIVPLRDQQTPPPPLPEWTTLKTTFSTVFWRSIDRQQEGPLLSKPKTPSLHNWISMPLLESSCFYDWTPAGHSHVMSLLRQIHVKLLYGTIISMPQLQHIFPSHMTQFQNSFNGSQSFFSHIIRGMQLMGKREFILTQSGSSVRQL